MRDLHCHISRVQTQSRTVDESLDIAPAATLDRSEKTRASCARRINVYAQDATSPSKVQGGYVEIDVYATACAREKKKELRNVATIQSSVLAASLERNAVYCTMTAELLFGLQTCIR